MPVLLDTSAQMTHSEYSDTLEKAMKIIEQKIIVDSQFPELSDRLKIGTIPTRSGLLEAEYPSQSAAFKGISQFRSSKKVPVPPQILNNNHHHAPVHIMMGMFPELGRAWLVTDSDLFLWNAEDGTDVALYDGAQECITCVGMAKAKSGVFHPDSGIHSLLLVCTPSTISAFGVGTTGEGGELLQLMAEEAVFAVGSDGACFTRILATTLGRVFMAAKDGNLYEFEYQNGYDWWGKRCRKVNKSGTVLSVLVPAFLNAFSEQDGLKDIVSDDSRMLLYTLTDKGSIDMYDLGADGWGFSKTASISYDKISYWVSRTLEEHTTFGPIINIHPVTLNESLHVALLGVMEFGVRIYFSLENDFSGRPVALKFSSVRMPPGYTGLGGIPRPLRVKMSLYDRGTCLLISTESESHYKLWCLSNDLTTFLPCLSETLSMWTMDSVVWAISKCPSMQIASDCCLPEPPALVRQHYEPCAKFICLTDRGSDMYKKLRPVDVLRELFEEGYDPGSEIVKNYFATLNEEEICAALLMIACQKIGNAQVSAVATRAFFAYGGEPKLISQHLVQQQQQLLNQTPSPLQHSLPVGFRPGLMSTPVEHNSVSENQSALSFSDMRHGSFVDAHRSTLRSPATAATAIVQSQTTPMGVLDPTTFRYSPKHNGLYLFLSRTLRPIWHLMLVERVMVGKSTQYIIPPSLIEISSLVLNHLAALSAFLKCNNVTSMPPAVSIMATNPTTRKMMRDMYAQEEKSLSVMKTFLTHAAQVIHLWKILYDHQFQAVAALMSPDELSYLEKMKFADLMLAGSEICNALIGKLLSLFLGDNSSVGSITAKLREVCPDLFLIEDAAVAEALELISCAKREGDEQERRVYLENSLKALKGVAPKFNLDIVCGQYRQAGFYEGIFAVCSECAAKTDSGGIGLRYYKEGGAADGDEYAAYLRRMECYKGLIESLEYLYSNGDQNEAHASSDSLINPPSFASKTRLQDFLSICLSSEDELLHAAVYEWMLAKNMLGLLVTHGRASLEFFLKRCNDGGFQRIRMRDARETLWAFFEKQGNYVAAANVLFEFAKEECDQVTLEDRLHALSHALVCLRSEKSGAAIHTASLYQEVTDALQVAQIQKMIMKTIKNMKFRDKETLLRKLNEKLYNLTELYEGFADEFDLWECKLAIIDCADMEDHDNGIVHQCWENIISETDTSSVTNTNDKMKLILYKIYGILKDVRKNSPIYDLEFLIFHLELIACQMKCSKNLVHETILTLNVPIEMLCITYEKLYVANSSCWKECGDEFHPVSAIGSLANTILNGPRDIYKRKDLLMLNDMIVHCLNMLYTKEKTEELDELIRWLRSVQCRIKQA